ncbi:GumC family protein [Hyphomicrobium sp.]|uniref:GumC family protein n=1 Tax=Hyphomicrobium sp. TaxID=82 RepID=UPI002FDCDC9C
MGSLIANTDDIDLGVLWRAAMRSLPSLAVLALALGSATYGVLGLIAPRYVSEAQLAIESKGTADPFADPVRGSSDNVVVRMDKEAVNTHVRALQSVDLAEAVIRDLKLTERAEFNAALGAPDRLSALLRRIGIGAPRASETDQDRALDVFFKRLEVYSPKESRFIGVRFTSIDPELAAAVANRIAETYRESLSRQALVQTDEVQKALEPKIARLAEEAAAAEAAVEQFRGEANIFKGGQQATGLNEQQLAELNAELSRIQAVRSEAEARAAQAREMQELGSAETLADVQRSPLILSLVQSRVRVERQISELSATLLPGHPRMRQLMADLKGLKSQIEAEAAKIVEGLGKEARVAALREEALQKSIADIKARIVSAGPEEARLRSLEADARSKRTELDRLRAQFEANRVRTSDSRAIPVEAQIVSSARPSGTPVFPRKAATAILMAIATMMIGLALVVTRGLLRDARTASQPGGRPPRNGRRDRRRRDRHQPAVPASAPARRIPHAHPARETATASAGAAVTPGPEDEDQRDAKSSSDPAGASLLLEDASEDVPAEGSGIEKVATGAAMAARIGDLRKGATSGLRTLFTGAADVFSLADEAAAISRTLADAGSAVIMVDWSLNGSGIAEPLGLPTWPGFAELVDGRARFEDVVRSLRDSDVHLIPCGRGAEDPGEPLDGDSLNFLLDALDDVYEHIIVVARTEPARRLFEAIEGRFDCAVTLVGCEAERSRIAGQGSGTFLGFDVEGIALFTLDQSEGLSRSGDKLERVG